MQISLTPVLSLGLSPAKGEGLSLSLILCTEINNLNMFAWK
jgi:hypothetical protein